MENRKLWIRIVVVLLVVLLVLTIAAPILSAAASSLSDLQRQYEQLLKEEAQLQSQINSTKNSISKQKQYSTQLLNQIALKNQEIGIINQQISDKEADIAAREADVSNKQKDIDSKSELLKSRLRAMYMSSESSVLVLLLESKSFADFLTASETVTRIYQNDKGLINELMDQKAQIEAAKKELEDAKATLEAKKGELATAKQQLQNSKNESDKVITSLSSQQSQQQKELNAIEGQEANMANEILAIIKQGSSLSGYVGGNFLWPVPNYYTITCPFGWRYISGRYDYHTGMDISGGNIYGKPIVAANMGIVKYIKYDPNGGGNYLMLDHGGGYYTLYAHCSSIIVKTGQWVSKGQTIAYVGSTGWSTGPHLHFEIWEGGTQKNPQNYF